MRSGKADGGFSLLEVMVAIGLLALGLVVVARVVTGNVRATHHARMITAATFLARVHIALVEQSLLDDGFGEVEGEDQGDFTEEGFPHFRWYSNVERIELPENAGQKVQEISNEQTESTNPMEVLSGFMGGFMSMLMEPIRLGLQESVRKLTVRVMWHEAGRPEQIFEIVSYVTDPAQLENAVKMAMNPDSTATQTSTGTGTQTSTSTSTATSTSPRTRKQ
jgi:prepilin-type N-terminal cleavage/methylation domain-containing protein